MFDSVRWKVVVWWHPSSHKPQKPASQQNTSKFNFDWNTWVLVLNKKEIILEGIPQIQISGLVVNYGSPNTISLQITWFTTKTVKYMLQALLH